MLYECATGVKPFTGNSPYSLMHAIVTAKIAPPSAFDPALPPEFDEVVLRAMNRDPAKRFESVREMGARLFAVGERGGPRAVGERSSVWT